jgi:hypothetical protein
MKANTKTLLRLLKAKRLDLAKSSPKSRDRIRRQLRALEVARQIKSECRSAA